MKNFEPAGVLDPEAFALAARVFDRILTERHIRRDTMDAEDIALRVVHFAHLGLDEHSLYAAATGRLEDAIAHVNSLTAPSIKAAL